ncbi:MAG TPA: hypothetical protein VGJ20_46300, partial [Xanthobacteraceae bacterium]
LLAPNEVRGLAIRAQNGKWIEPPAIPGAFVVNGGQLLQRSGFPILAAEPPNSTNAFLISTSNSEGNTAEAAALVFTNPVLNK